MKARRSKRRQKMIDLLGGKCSNCGSKNQLEFDHKNPKKKSFDYNDIQDGPEDLILKEVNKCNLLCKPCHFKKTMEKQEFVNKDKKPSDHGSVWHYKRHKCRCDKCRKAISDYYYSRKVKLI